MHIEDVAEFIHWTERCSLTPVELRMGWEELDRIGGGCNRSHSYMLYGLPVVIDESIDGWMLVTKEFPGVVF